MLTIILKDQAPRQSPLLSARIKEEFSFKDVELIFKEKNIQLHVLVDREKVVDTSHSLVGMPIPLYSQRVVGNTSLIIIGLQSIIF